MSSLLKQNKPPSPKPANIGFSMTLAFICAIAASIAWYYFGSVTSATPTAKSEAGAEAGSKGSRGSHSSKQLAANELRRQMLELEKDLKSKYAKKNKKQNRWDLPDKDKAYRKWRDQKEQTEAFYSRFKDDPTTDPNSVKVQMQQTLKRLESDRPDR